MLSHSQDQKQATITKNTSSAACQDGLMNSSQVRVGSKTVMTRAERIQHLRNSSLGRLYGVEQSK